MSKKLLFISGSTRTDSYNIALAQAAKKIADSLGATTECIDLSDYEMPLYNQDYEADHGLPKSAIALKAKMVAADGFFFTTPEYNSSFSPLLKNSIDWVSRKHLPDEPGLQAFMDKGAAIAAASPGALGGIRALVPLRLLLANIGMNVVGNQLALSQAHQGFKEDGSLSNEAHEKILNGIVKTLIRIS